MKHHISIWDKYSRLTVISINMIKKWNHNRIYCTCICECWNNKIVYKWSLVNWDTTSCGCYQKTISTKAEWMHWSVEYTTYHQMLARCYNKNNKYYKYYWWRWISVCDKWMISFKNFYLDMWDRPEWKSIDRIDNDWNYCPENCRRADNKTQRNNQSNTIKNKLKKITKDLFSKYISIDTFIIMHYL